MIKRSDIKSQTQLNRIKFIQPIIENIEEAIMSQAAIGLFKVTIAVTHLKEYDASVIETIDEAGYSWTFEETLRTLTIEWS